MSASTPIIRRDSFKPSTLAEGSGAGLAELQRSTSKKTAKVERRTLRKLLREVTESLKQGRLAGGLPGGRDQGFDAAKSGGVDGGRSSEGGQIGTLGGGCVEAEVKQKAIARLGRSGAELLSFVLDHDYAWADGLICGGKMVILAESIEGESALKYLRAYCALDDAGEGFIEAILVEPSRRDLPAEALGTGVLIGPNGEIVAEKSKEANWAAAIGRDAPSLETRPCGLRKSALPICRPCPEFA